MEGLEGCTPAAGRGKAAGSGKALARLGCTFFLLAVRGVREWKETLKLSSEKQIHIFDKRPDD